jgi:hypothetical protein
MELSWNFQRLCTLTGMTDFENRVKPPVSREERAAKMEKRRLEAEQALIERKKADDAFRANFERLKAARLARETIDS